MNLPIHDGLLVEWSKHSFYTNKLQKGNFALFCIKLYIYKKSFLIMKIPYNILCIGSILLTYSSIISNATACTFQCHSIAFMVMSSLIWNMMWYCFFFEIQADNLLKQLCLPILSVSVNKDRFFRCGISSIIYLNRIYQVKFIIKYLIV